MIQPNNVVDHIASFTSHRDLDLLAFSLLKSINTMIASSKAMIISIDRKGHILSQIVFEDNARVVNKTGIQIQAELLDAFEKMHDLSVDEYTLKTEQGYALIHLLHQDRKSEQFLVANLKEKTDKIQAYILSGILSIYSNFMTLLTDAQTDELTGLANRKTFDSSIAKIYENMSPTFEIVDDERRAEESNAGSKICTYWLAIIDIDNFKSVNDRFGHLYGDEILIHLAQIIRTNFRQSDLQFRFGGEEFIVLLYAESMAICLEILNRFRINVESHDFPKVEQITVSIGVVEFKEEVFHVSSIDFADQALYFSKKNGKNKITFFEDMVTSGEASIQSVEGGEIDLF